jgi:hypothetical protein
MSKYIPGDHWVECELCAKKLRRSKAKLRWDGLVVCADDWEPRHPQDYVRTKTDQIAAQGLVTGKSEDTFKS